MGQGDLLELQLQTVPAESSTWAQMENQCESPPKIANACAHFLHLQNLTKKLEVTQ